MVQLLEQSSFANEVANRRDCCIAPKHADGTSVRKVQVEDSEQVPAIEEGITLQASQDMAQGIISLQRDIIELSRRNKAAGETHKEEAVMCRRGMMAQRLLWDPEERKEPQVRSL